MGKMGLGNAPHSRIQYIELDRYLPLIVSAPSNMSGYPLFSISLLYLRTKSNHVSPRAI